MPPPVAFDDFKTYFEFAIEVVGVSGVIGTAAYKLNVMKAFWRVARGRANSTDEALAMEVLENGGAVAQQVVRELADVSRAGAPAMARRLDEIREAAHSRPASPGQMV
jgi:hypothetical protein